MILIHLCSGLLFVDFIVSNDRELTVVPTLLLL